MKNNSLVTSLKTAALVVAVLFAAAQASARTFPTKTYEKDPAANFNHIFGTYKPLANYTDADFAEGAAMASPLYNPIYASYDVIVVVNRTSVVSKEKKVLERAQRVRVYVREEALARLNQNNMQKLTYDQASGLIFYFKTSTGSPGHGTPGGHYRVLGFSSDHKSSKYGLAPMPNAVWFNEVGIFTHGVDPKLFGILGNAASHGCVRLETQRAGDLFHLVGQVGAGQVDQLDRNGTPLKDASGAPRKISAYKTLYIVR